MIVLFSVLAKVVIGPAILPRITEADNRAAHL
jgi:hypothetical protein